MISKKDQMISFWSERAKLYKDDPRANTNDVWLREIEIDYVDKIIKSSSVRKIMDFGCANGYSTGRLAKLNPESKFVGIDINPDMIDAAKKFSEEAKIPKLSFKRADVLNDEATDRFDFIYAIRVFQNLESFDMQKRVFDKLYQLLDQQGVALYIESYLDGYTRLNEDRVKMNLAPLPIHEHLTLLTDEFDHHVSRKMKLLKSDSLSSSYYLVTRILYSYIAKINDEQIDYNHPLHQVGAMIPQIGEYGPQKASLYLKR